MHLKASYVLALLMLLASAAESNMLLYKMGLLSGGGGAGRSGRSRRNQYMQQLRHNGAGPGADPDQPLSSLSHEELQKLQWWKDKRPSMLISRWDHRLEHYKKPPNLLSPGVFKFRKPASTDYYFHNKGARIVKSSHFMMRYHLGRKISFVCVARGVPRPQITWLKDGMELNSYAGYEGVGVSEWRKGEDLIKSKLEIDPAMPKDAGFYECQTDNKFAIDNRGFIAKYELN